MAKRKISSTKRFGQRYGRTLKLRLENIESLQKATYRCPYCDRDKVKWQSVGIWSCRNCNKKFTSKAYHVDTRKTQ